jgi:hypothetical protein
LAAAEYDRVHRARRITKSKAVVTNASASPAPQQCHVRKATPCRHFFRANRRLIALEPFASVLGFINVSGRPTWVAIGCFRADPWDTISIVDLSAGKPRIPIDWCHRSYNRG